jgi:hypothetical protein
LKGRPNPPTFPIFSPPYGGLLLSPPTSPIEDFFLKKKKIKRDGLERGTGLKGERVMIFLISKKIRNIEET